MLELPNPENKVGARWRCSCRDALLCREWDGEGVVRNATTGNTHLLSHFGTTVLLALIASESELSVSALAEKIAGDESDDPELTNAIEIVLLEFERLGLVHRGKC